MKKNILIRKNKNLKYPSAEFVQQACFEDYRRLIDSYDKIYEKVNITLAFCGIILLVIIGNVNYTYVSDICRTQSNLELIFVLLLLLCSVTSAVCIIWAVIQLLLLMRSKELTVFDSIGIRNDKIYEWNLDEAALWLIDKYTMSIVSLREIIDKKQKIYDDAVTKVIIALLLYSVILIIEKGM